jgi:hypothetical protein
MSKIGFCDLEAAVGRTTACPGEPCVFWEHGGCLIAPLRADLERNRELAYILLPLRAKLGSPSIEADLPPGLRE